MVKERSKAGLVGSSEPLLTSVAPRSLQNEAPKAGIEENDDNLLPFIVPS